jgi:hypothetical protein
MEDIRKYHSDEDEARRISDADRREYGAAPADDEVPLHIPRD